MEAEHSPKRRRHSRELNARIVAECEVPGTSVAKVALAHGINSNIVHGWRKLARHAGPAAVPQEFVLVAVTPSKSAVGDDRGHFVDHLPYYRIEQMNARSDVHTPRSTLASWGGKTGAQLMPLFEAHRAFVLGARVLHADETPMPLLDPGSGKTRRAYMWTYARGAFDPDPGVAYDFCLGRGGQYPLEFLKGWSGTLGVDAYAGYDSVVALPGRTAAFCVAHARRGFDEIIKTSTAASPIAAEAVRRIVWLYVIEAELRALDPQERLRIRQARSRPLWDELHFWLQLQRARVPDGSTIAKAIDYSLNRWSGLGQFLLDGDVPIDNNHCENRIRPVGLSKKNSLLICSQLAGERAAVVMSLLRSAKLNAHEPWAYLKDVLTRLPTQLNSRIEELLPHRWRPRS